MAEAPGPAGPPRKTQTLNKFSTMASQNQREGTKEDEFFWLENIMRVAPHKLHSVPGPRTIQSFPAPSNTCPDDAPGAQALAQVCCYDNTLWVFPQGTASSLSHIPDDFTFWCTSSLQSGTGSTSPYPVSSPQEWYLWTPTAPTGPSCALTDITASAPLPFPHTITSWVTQGAQAGRSGKSDENSYVLGTIGGDLGHPYAAYFGESSGFTPLIDTFNFAHSGLDSWTKYDGFYYSHIWSSTGNIAYLTYWAVPSGVHVLVKLLWSAGVADPSSPLPGVNNNDQILAMQANADALYVLKKAATDTTAKLCVIDKTTLVLQTQYTLSAGGWPDLANCFNFDIFSSNLIFLITKNTSGNSDIHTVFTIGWFKPLTNTFFPIGTFTTACSQPYSVTTSPSGTSAFFYKKNYFFVGGDAGNVLKLGPLVCPSNPNIPWENV